MLNGRLAHTYLHTIFIFQILHKDKKLYSMQNIKKTKTFQKKNLENRLIFYIYVKVKDKAIFINKYKQFKQTKLKMKNKLKNNS